MINIISKEPTPEEIKFLDDMIYEHNSLTTKKYNGKLFAKLIYDSEKKIIAGIAGWTWANVCEINLFWVKKELRKKGIGKILLTEAEIEAKKEKCKSIFLRTYSFQAPKFYQKYGFRIVYELKDFPPGHISHCLLKELIEN